MAVIGLDIGTTSAKAVAYRADGTTAGAGRAPTPWTTTPLGVEMDAHELLDSARTALATAADQAGEPIAAVGIASMAESGVLVDAAGRPVAPVIAWHDARDAIEVQELREVIGAAEFAARAGKPLRGQWSITKHRWLRRHHPPVATAHRRFNVAEWVLRGLGGPEVTELSLACRTGWFDVRARAWWSAGLAFSGADESLLPPLVEAGTPLGTVSGAGRDNDQFGTALTGAILTLAGHDHQAAALGVGAARDGVELDSCGTAEALVRTVAGPLSEEQIQALAAHGITTDVSIRAEHLSLLGGTEGGLTMQRVLGMLDVDRNDLAVLDRAAAAAPVNRVQIDGMGSAFLSIRGVTDGVTSAEVWRAAVQAATDDAARLHRAMDDIVGPVQEVVVTGGWAHSALFMDSKRAALGGVRRSEVAEAGTRGAAVLAARAAGILGPAEHFPADSPADPSVRAGRSNSSSGGGR